MLRARTYSDSSSHSRCCCRSSSLRCETRCPGNTCSGHECRTCMAWPRDGEGRRGLRGRETKESWPVSLRLVITYLRNRRSGRDGGWAVWRWSFAHRPCGSMSQGGARTSCSRCRRLGRHLRDRVRVASRYVCALADRFWHSPRLKCSSSPVMLATRSPS